MISQTNSSAVRTAYANSFGESKEAKATDATVSKQGDTSKIERIKESLEAGEYKVDLEALSKKIAEELL
ncbi:MAG: flagellar biosynthesis anti-sigma factor FlgM [Campylobacterota bacterium]|nr:flagellar biosynthesis anti-sigma factor FlgM [Campylobacterota bacterium]